MYATVLIAFKIVDFSKSHMHDHFDVSKTSKEHKKKVKYYLSIIKSINDIQYSDFGICYSTGYEQGANHYPGHYFKILIDVNNYQQIVRYYALFQAIANMYAENLKDFDFEVMKYDADAKYRRDYVNKFESDTR